MKNYNFAPVKVTPDEKPRLTFNSIEDTYVINGDSVSGANGLASKNFSDSPVLHFKANDGSGMLNRMVLVKFNISEIEKAGGKKIDLVMSGIGCQTHNGGAVRLYGIVPDSWKASEVTYDTAPEYSELITVCDSVGNGNNFFDVTDYIKKAISKGEKIVSFMLVGDDKEPIHIQFASSKNEKGNGPKLSVSFSDNGFYTNLGRENSQEIWDCAAEMVKEWSADWERILGKGDANSERVYEKKEEYSKNVGAHMSGNMKFVDRPTRTMDAILEYEPVKDGEIELDEYGGHVCNKKFEATGFFHVENKYGRLWTVTPLGNPFYRMAMVLLSPGASPNQRKVVLSKCGTVENWAKKETQHMRSDLYFNSLGGWSDITVLSKVDKPLALTSIIYFLSTYTREYGMNTSVSGNTTFSGGVMPVFDPSFEKFSDERAKKIVALYADNKAVYGWMSDNELHAELKMLDNYLSADHTNPWFSYSYATAWSFVRYMSGKENVCEADITNEMRKQFRAMVYNKYFKIVTNAIKKVDSNHMFLGCRFLQGCYADEYVNRVAGEYCDVISFNYYGAWQPNSELMENIQKWSNTPFIITEWYAKGDDACTKENGLTNMSGAGWTCRTQKDRGYFYHNFTLKLMECKGNVGFDWFQCWDNDFTNTSADLSNRNSNKGIYSSDYEEYTDLTDEMKIINKNAYKLIEFFDKDETRSH